MGDPMQQFPRRGVGAGRHGLIKSHNLKYLLTDALSSSEGYDIFSSIY
jgi:hypothetical protein